MSHECDDVALTVSVMDGQYRIHSLSEMVEMWPGSQEGLFVGEDNWVAILCGTQWGPVDLRIRACGRPPGEVERGWDMVAEWSLDCSDGRLTIHDLYSSEPPEAIDVVPGWMRLRLSVRDRARASRTPEPLETAVEHHFLQLWPAPNRQDPSVVHGPDEHAQFLR
ncbi:hypothetical protein ACL03H_17310 [Saccharopolyspora sp. MS10]|uniref:hypothetical protein n=1 Tax=Saccharopolyspora sp. MS10 TaxID=3385973 RepID=UPI00399F45A9